MEGFEVFRTIILVIFLAFVFFALVVRWYGKRKGLAIIIALMKMSRNKEAKEQLDYYIKYFPRSKRAWALLGATELELDNLSNAKIAYERSLRLDPNFSYALGGMGVVYRRRKKFDKAEDYYYRALKSNPDNHRAKSSLMLLELYKGSYDIAISLGEDSIKSGLDNVGKPIVGNLAIAYHLTEEYDKRDELVDYLRINEYKDLFYLLLFIEGKMTIEMIFSRGL